MPKQKKIPVSKAALIRRINRKLAHDDQILKATRGARAIQDVGDYYIVDSQRNFAVANDVDPEDLARELEVLHEWERAEGL